MIFNYGDLTWPNRQVEKNIHAGYYFGSLNKMFNFNLSMMSNVATLSQQSNCNVKGKYLLRLNHSGIEFLINKLIHKILFNIYEFF